MIGSHGHRVSTSYLIVMIIWTCMNYLSKGCCLGWLKMYTWIVDPWTCQRLFRIYGTGGEYFDSPQRLRPLDLHSRLWPTTAHLAKWAGDLGGWHSCHGQSFCAPPRLHQLLPGSNASILPQTKWSISGWCHDLHARILVVKLRLCHVSHPWCRRFPALARECCIVHMHCLRRQQHSHHSG